MLQLTLPLLVPILGGGLSVAEPPTDDSLCNQEANAFVEDLGARIRAHYRAHTQSEPRTPSAKGEDAFATSPSIHSMEGFVDAVSEYGHGHSLFVRELIHSIHLARFVDHAVGEAACETVWTHAGSTYNDGASWLITHPNGTFDLIDEDGQVTPTSEFTLLPVGLTELPFHIYPDDLRAQIEPLAEDFFDYAIYSATLPDGSQHGGLSAHFDDGNQVHITLYPDSVSGGQLIPPSDLMLMRWFLWENPAVTAGVLLNALIPSYAPPTWTPPSHSDGAPRSPRAPQGIDIPDDIEDCMWRAIMRWKTSLDWAEQDYEEHLRVAEEDYEADIEVFDQCLEDYARQTGGLAAVSHTVSSWFGLNIARDTYQQYIDGFREINEDEYKQDKENAETNLKNRRKNIADRLIRELENCLAGFPEIQAALAPYLAWRDRVHQQNQ